MTRIRTLSTQLQTIPRPSWLSRATWPFETFGIPLDGSLLAVTEAGAGPTLLFVHAGTWSFIWRDLVRQLATDFRCVFFDAPGSGQSRGGQVSMKEVAEAVKAVISGLELQDFTLIAHDLGGPPALAAVASVGERVRGIVAMNTFGWQPEGAALRGMLTLVGSRLIRSIDVLTGFIPHITASSFGVGRHYDDESRNAFLAGMDKRGRRTFHDYMYDALRCEALYRDATQALTGVLAGVPLLTVFGERNDPFGFQKEWKRLFPEARQVVIEKGNHFPMCDAPEFAADTIRSWFRERVGETSVSRR